MSCDNYLKNDSSPFTEEIYDKYLGLVNLDRDKLDFIFEGDTFIARRSHSLQEVLRVLYINGLVGKDDEISLCTVTGDVSWSRACAECWNSDLEVPLSPLCYEDTGLLVEPYNDYRQENITKEQLLESFKTEGFIEEAKQLVLHRLHRCPNCLKVYNKLGRKLV